MNIPFPKDETGYTPDELVSIIGANRSDVERTMERLLFSRTVGVAPDGGELIYVNDAVEVMREFIGKPGCNLTMTDINRLFLEWLDGKR